MIKLRVHVILEEQGKTAYWLSKQTGISPNNISKICNGETTTIRFDTLEKLCIVLKCPINELFDIEDSNLAQILQFDKFNIVLQQVIEKGTK